MKYFLKICIAAMLLASILSCDAFRKFTGRPTSDEMEAKLRKIEQIEEARLKAQERSKAENDSIKAARPTARERAAEIKSIQQKAFERAEAEAMAKRQAKAAAAEAKRPGTNDEIRTASSQASTRPSPAKTESVASTRPSPAKTESVVSSKYDVVIGAFIYEENANRLHARVQADGYDPRIVKQGQWAVVYVSCHADNYADAVQFFDKIRKEPFCPENAWLQAR